MHQQRNTAMQNNELFFGGGGLIENIFGKEMGIFGKKIKASLLQL